MRAELAQLRKLLADAQQVIAELRNENQHLRRENEKLHKRLRKYENENTPLGMRSPYLKTSLERIIEQARAEEKKEPGQLCHADFAARHFARQRKKLLGFAAERLKREIAAMGKY